VDTIEELSAVIGQGVAIVPWCGERGCADFIEETVNASVLGTEVQANFACPANGVCVACGKKGTATLVGRSY
jgi:prolyl-tRNA synthetase